MSRPFARNVAAIATPFHDDLSVDFERLIAHAKRLLDEGCDGILLYGTTGEAASLTLDERRQSLEALLRGGIDPRKVLVGTGCCAAADTLALTKHAASMECAGALVLPPYFYKGVSDDGIAAFIGGIVDACSNAIPIYLYHIPPVAVVGFSPALVKRLRERYGDGVCGYKDSSGIFSNTTEILAHNPGFDVYVGSETLLSDNLRAGGAGSISASANVQPAAIRRILETEADGGAAQDAATAMRKTLEKFGPLLVVCKVLLARIHNHPGWSRVRPPLVPLAEDACARLLGDVRALGFSV